MPSFSRFTNALLAGALLASCSTTPNTAENGTPTTPVPSGKADFTDPLQEPGGASKCEANNRTGTDIDGAIFGHLDDPIAKLLADDASSCPTTLQGILDELKVAVEAGKSDCNLDSLRTMIVTESHQILDRDVQTSGGFRTVTAIDCGEDRGNILFSSDGSFGDGFLEIMALDETAGVFNYYDRLDQNGKLSYFGHSQMFVANPPENGSGRTNRKCGACHSGGGLVMKELAAPWLHWEGDTTTKGAAALISANAERLGNPSNGIEMESITRNGNRIWNETRIEFLKDNTESLPKAFDSILTGNQELNPTQKLLEPLFCVTEVNLDNASSQGRLARQGEVDQTGGVTFAPLGGPVLPIGFGSLNFSADNYDTVLDTGNYGVFSGNTRIARDTHFALPFITRGEADVDFIQKLQQAGIVDNEFVDDVLAVDLTRAISTDRCELLRKVPNLAPENRTANEIRAAFINSLKDGGAVEQDQTPAQELLNNFLNPDDNHQQKSQAFTQACQGRLTAANDVANAIRAATPNTERFELQAVWKQILVDAGLLTQADEAPKTENEAVAIALRDGLVEDYMLVIEAGRDAARKREVFEFPMTMQQKPGQTPFATRLHPTTCEITTEFVALSEKIDRATSCVGRCEVIDDTAECQCDSQCIERGDCCEGDQGFEAQCLIGECQPDICEVDQAPKPKKGCKSPEFEADLEGGQTCVEKICAADPFCCESSFDNACVNRVNDTCGFECPNGGGGPIIEPGPIPAPIPFPNPGPAPVPAPTGGDDNDN